jgi:outer membrane protein TolC
MRRLFLLLALVVPLGAAGSAAAERYTVDALVRRVERTYPSVAAAREELAGYDGKRLEQQLRWMPFGEFAFSVSGAPKVACVDLPGGPPMPSDVLTANCIRTNNVDLLRGSGSLAERSMFGGSTVRVDIGLTQPLITSGKLEAAALDLGRTGARAGRGFLARDKGDAVQKAIEVYWQLKAARAAVTLFEESLATVRNWTQRIEDELSGANVLRYTEADAARMKIMLANVEATMLFHKRNEAAALGALRAMTDDPRADVDEAEIALVAALEDEGGIAPWESWVETARTRRPESRLINLLVDEGRGWWKLRLAELFPDVGIQSGFSYGDAPNVARPQRAFLAYWPNPLGVYFGLGLRQPLDFGPRAARLEAAAADRRSREAKREMYRGFIAIDTINAWASLKEARERVRECERGEKITRGWFASVDENLALGLWTDGREMLEVVQGWIDFRVRKVYAIADANMRLAWLERASGTLRGLDDAELKEPR